MATLAKHQLAGQRHLLPVDKDKVGVVEAELQGSKDHARWGCKCPIPVCALDAGACVAEIANTFVDSVWQLSTSRIVVALWNVLTISFHSVKFLLKPSCDTKILVCLKTKRFGVLPTPSTVPFCKVKVARV